MDEKKLNHFQRKEIAKYIEGQEKPLDDLAQQMFDNCTLYALTNNEIASVLFTVMRNTLMQPHNQANLERKGISQKDLTIDNVLTIQNIFVKEYLKSNKK